MLALLQSPQSLSTPETARTPAIAGRQHRRARPLLSLFKTSAPRLSALALASFLSQPSTSTASRHSSSAAFFNCSGHLNNAGAAFLIANSSVTITGISFENCFNPNSNGGAVSAYGSNVVVSRCSFINCSAASGGAIAATALMGPSQGLFLNVHNSSFFGNSANGGLSACPSDAEQPNQPCSTWGGAVAAFDMLNVTVSGCKMEANRARATVPTTSLQQHASRNAVSGGGCVSVLFYGNASGSVVQVSGNTFEQCVVDVSSTANVSLVMDTEALFLSISAFCLDFGNSMFHFSTWRFTTTCSLVVK